MFDSICIAEILRHVVPQDDGWVIDELKHFGFEEGKDHA